MDNFLDSYLVSLGFETDEPSFSKLKNSLVTAESAVTQHTTGMVRRVLEFQGSIIGSFAAVSAAILGTVDRAAMADQSYRLMGLSMLMTTESARKMSIITDTLGASMGEIIWDPELHARAQMLGADIDRMTQKLGPGFEGSMRSIRDFRAEFGRLEVGVQFLGMRFAEDLWAKLMPGAAGKSLHDWITGMEERIPEFSGKLVRYAGPALEKTWEMAKAVGYVVEQGAIAFTNLIGTVSGDKSIEGAAFSFGHLATAIEHVGDWMKQLFLWLAQGELALVHFATGLVDLFEKKWGAAGKEFNIGVKVAQGESPEQIARETPNTYGLEKFDGKSIGDVVGGMFSGLFDSLQGKESTLADAFGKQMADSITNSVRNQLRGADLGQDLKYHPVLRNLPGMQTYYNFLYPPPEISKTVPYEPPAAVKRLDHEGLMKLLQRGAGAPDSISPSGSPPAIADFNQRFARAISEYEHAKPEWNNPGAIREWGSTPTVPFAGGTMAVFPTKEAGYEALLEQIGKNESRNLTLLEFFAGKKDVYGGYSPAGDGHNDPVAYAREMAQKLDIDVNTPLQDVLKALQAQNAAMPPMPKPAPIVGPPAIVPPSAAPTGAGPTSSLQPLWMAPHANDNTPRLTILPAAYPITAALSQQWAPMQAEMNRPVAPMANMISNSRTVTYGDIHVTIEGGEGLDADQVGRAVMEKLREKERFDAQVEIAQLTAAYA